jgi:hypothetical protein
MAKQSIALIVFVFSLLCIYFLQGCHNTAAPSVKLSFKDEKSMRMALEGTWILKEYEDSIDAGLTPKLLEYMLNDFCLLEFADSTCTAYSLYSFGANAPGTKKTVSSIASLILFPDLCKLLIIVPVADSGQVDTAFYEISGDDTILRLRHDSMELVFEKYIGNKCLGIDSYDHLVSSKFIAGKYYRTDDNEKQHHIIFTRCGNVEGAENISNGLATKTKYDVKLSSFLTEPDMIFFFSEARLSQEYFWQVNEDSLILSQRPEGNAQRIVLVKAQ